MDYRDDTNSSDPMTYRKAEDKDKDAINELAVSSGFHPPNIGICFVAEDNGKIVGYVNSGIVGFVESIVSKNPISSVRLFSMAEGAIQQTGIKPVFAGVINETAGKELEKFGYEELKNTKFYIRNK
jgi:hypothetical protein